MGLPYLDLIRKVLMERCNSDIILSKRFKKNGSSMLNRNDTVASMKLRLLYLGMLTYCNCSRRHVLKFFLCHLRMLRVSERERETE
jgi:hypothetical protein